MASIRNIFLKGVETVFNVFNEAVKSGTYNVDIDDGFVTATTSTDTIRCIFETFEEKDVAVLSFSELIQPQDIKGLMPSVDLVNCEMTTQGYCIFGTEKYAVEAFELDPMDVIYTLLLRRV